MVSLPIFIILIGVLVSISNLTTVPWNIEPTGQSMATLTDDTDPALWQVPETWTASCRSKTA